MLPAWHIWDKLFLGIFFLGETRHGASVRSGECCLWVKIFGGIGFCGIKYYATVETRRGTSLLWRVCTVGGMLFVGKNIRGCWFLRNNIMQP